MLGSHLVTQINRALCNFSRAYDQFVDDISKNLVQISSPDKPNGWFYIDVPQLTLRILAAEITPATSFEAFADLCFQVFWERLERSLETVRSTIDEVLKPRMNGLFVALETELAGIPDDADVVEVNNAIVHAQTKAQDALDRVKEWFHVAKPLSTPEFGFGDLVDIGLQCVKNSYPAFKPDVSIKSDVTNKFIQLSLFCDIFFIIFHNVSRHSGLERPRVDVEATIVQNMLQIIVTSDVKSDEKRIVIERNVDRIKSDIKNGAYQGILRSEGGSGLSKLHSLIRGHGHSSNQVEFGLAPDGRFRVHIAVALSALNDDEGEPK